MTTRFQKIFEISLKADLILDGYPNRGGYPDRVTIMMDIDNADKQFNLRLDDFLNAEPFDFMHDVCGIVQNIDRETGKIGNLFVPRFAGRKE